MDNGKVTETDNDYAVSGKIMLIAIVVLFIVIIFMLCLHVQIRWYLLRARRRQHLRRTRHVRPPELVFYVDPAAPAALTLSVSRGLDASVISSLPVFNFSPKAHPEAVECPVCLSEFEDGETGRILPKCNHSFHIDCIDMWFQSHSTCPLCRAPVEPLPVQETRPEVTVAVCEPEPGRGSSSGLCAECLHGGEEVNRSGLAVSSSSFSTGKPSSLLGVTVEVPGRSESFGGVSGCDSSSSSSSFRSPMSRVLSLTRILGRERKPSVSPSSDCIVVCDPGTERGGGEEIQ